MSFNITHPYAADDALTATEAALVQLIEEYRVQSGLAPIRLSRSLSLVAARHDEDILYNLGGYQAGIAGQNSVHSWSNAPYNALDPTTYSAIWAAPQRLGTAYKSAGYEILAGYLAPNTAAATIAPATALAGWQSSAPHNALLLNLGTWTGYSWGAMGIGVKNGVASVWFGADPDPAGSPDVILQGRFREYGVTVAANAIRVTDTVANRDPAFTIPNAATLIFSDGAYDVASQRFTYTVPPSMLGVANASKGTAAAIAMDQPDAGGPSYLQSQYIYSGADDVALSTSAPNVFLHSGSGNDALQAASGRNVLDGGLGSNFLTGGSGQDTFFTDARAAGIVWNTIRNFKPGDAATLWGFVAGASSYRWESTVAGAAGSEGATLRANVAGRSPDGIDASITFAGISVETAKTFQIATGTQPAGSYLFITT